MTWSCASPGWTAIFRGITTTRTSCFCAGRVSSGSSALTGIPSSSAPANSSSCPRALSIGRLPTTAPRTRCSSSDRKRSNMATTRSRSVQRREPDEAPTARIPVRKTYKLYVGGQFPRSESGRSYVVRASDGTPLANAVRSSRKDLRDAIRTARGAVAGWSGKTAMNRGQVLYRVAELMEGRRDQFEAEVAAAEGAGDAAAREQVDRSIDRWVWYAGWADKITQLLGTVNPVAASYFNFTIPEPTGVVGIVAPETSSLLGLVSRLAPAVVSGNTAVVLASET